MTQEHWKLAWGLICEIQSRPAAERDAVLRDCQAPETVIEHVRSVIAADAEEAETDPLSEEGSLGPYRLVSLLGQGSMGTVYLAEQQKPLQRMVALKLIRPGLHSDEVLERFEIERRALAMMDHPHIARVFDAGQTRGGNPYFAMEFVPGAAITVYCEQRQAALRQKIELLITACEAIQHAHQKGIVHRDIKPSNVLVSEVGGRAILKIIDFGIARATQEAGMDTLSTRFGGVVGTTSYMSPEQAAHDAIDTRSDVYSLGVLAYELLTGSTPLRERATAANLASLLEKVRQEEPEPPSRRAPALAKQLAGELDWMVMRALEKDPARRYQTANGFALDLQRYLRGEPVEAGPVSPTYRLKKLAMRHRALLGIVAAFALVLTLATLASIRQAVRATRAEQQAILSRDRAVRAEAEAVASRDAARLAGKAAEAERDRALAERRRADREAVTTRAVSDFLQNDLLKLANTVEQANRGYATPSRDITVREALDRAAAAIGTRFQNQPAVEAEIRHTIGTTYFNLDLLTRAKTQLEVAHRLRKASFGAGHAATLDSLHGIGMVLRAQGRFAEAHEVFSQVVAGRMQTLGPEHRETLQAMHSAALVLRSQGKTTEAIAQHRRILTARRRVLGEEDPDTLRSLNDLGVANIYAGNDAVGVELAEQAYRIRARVLGPEHPDTVVSMQAYGMGLFETGQGEKSLEILQRTQELSERLRGPDHANTLNAAGSMGNACITLGRFAEAVTHFVRAADGFTRLHGERNSSALVWRANAAVTMLEAGQFAEGVAALRALLPVLIAIHGPEHGETLRVRHALANGLLASGQPDGAIETGVPVLADRTRIFGPRHVSTARITEVVAEARVRKGQLQEAEALYRDAVAVRRQVNADASKLEAGLAAVWLRQGKYAEAAALAQSSRPQEKWTAGYLQAIGAVAQAKQGRMAEAKPILLAAQNAMAAHQARTGATEHHKLESVRRWIAELFPPQP